MSEKEKRIKPWCVRCQTTYDRNFYVSLNKNHTSGYLPYCKKCIGDIHRGLFYKYNEDLEVSIYYTCMVVDVPYRKATLDLANNQIEKENEKEATPLHEAYKYYFSYLNNAMRGVVDINFGDSDVSIKALKVMANFGGFSLDEKIAEWNKEVEDETAIKMRELREKFGSLYSDEKLVDLKRRYDKWDEGANLNTVALQKLVVQMVVLEQVIEEKLARGEDSKKEFDMYAKLLDQTGLKPVANTGVSDTRRNIIGMRIKELEERRPAEDLELRRKYGDLDNFEKYHRDYFVAPQKRSFGIEDSDTESMDREVAKYKLSSEDMAMAGIVDDE